MNIQSAEYISSLVDFRKGPRDGKPEIAFIGRSNVGKSSLINMLTNRKKLALTSATPGKTRTINHFLINDEFYFVDLPGYGYAKSSRDLRKDWQKSTWQYLRRGESLFLLFVLIDSTLKPQPADLNFINRLGEENIPFALVFTKADRSRPAVLKSNTDAFTGAMLSTWRSLPPVFITSAHKAKGKEEVLDYLDEILADRLP